MNPGENQSENPAATGEKKLERGGKDVKISDIDLMVMRRRVMIMTKVMIKIDEK